MKGKQKIYVMNSIDTSAMLQVSHALEGTQDISMPLTWHDGQVGAVPVFTVKRKAEKAARQMGATFKTMWVPRGSFR